MKLTIISRVLVLTMLLIVAVPGFGQSKLLPLSVHRSTLIEQLKRLKAADPKQNADDFAKAANILLNKAGVNFSISLDAATCELLRTRKAALKDPSMPLRVSGKLNSVDADTASLGLPEPSFAAKDCGDCFVELPLLEIQDKTFVTVVQGRNIKFHLPTNFYVNEVKLLDPTNPDLIRRKWRIPSRLSPIGVSYDENVLYLAFDEPELAEFSLFVFGEGVIQIGTRRQAEDGGKGKILTTTADAHSRSVRFDRWQRSYILSYKPKCGDQTL